MYYISLDDLALYGMILPEKCLECKFCLEDIPGWNETRTFHCVLKGSEVRDIFSKPKWCPIKEGTCIPSK